ncbi:MAG: helix-turn-helix domain-containing protein [Oligoflexia bacterium]|nr:helix-turn-helix domain-containing protein [Oligoflexia bacterium]
MKKITNKPIGKKTQNKTKKTKPLRLLTRSNVKALPQSRKSIKLEKAGSPSRPSGLLFDNLISVEELAVILRLAPQTIRNWVALGKIPYVTIGRKRFFQERSLQRWLNQKEEPQWQ